MFFASSAVLSGFKNIFTGARFKPSVYSGLSCPPGAVRLKFKFPVLLCPVLYFAAIKTRIGSEQSVFDRRVRSVISRRAIAHGSSEVARVDAVERRRLVQPDERVGVVPVSAWTGMTIDDHHRCVALGVHDIGKRHAHGTRADDQIVRSNLTHHAVLADGLDDRGLEERFPLVSDPASRTLLGASLGAVASLHAAIFE